MKELHIQYPTHLLAQDFIFNGLRSSREYQEATNIKPTGKWVIINGDRIRIEISYDLITTKWVIDTSKWYKLGTVKKCETEHKTAWIDEHLIEFNEIHSFDCNN